MAIRTVKPGVLPENRPMTGTCGHCGCVIECLFSDLDSNKMAACTTCGKPISMAFKKDEPEVSEADPPFPWKRPRPTPIWWSEDGFVPQVVPKIPRRFSPMCQLNLADKRAMNQETPRG